MLSSTQIAQMHAGQQQMFAAQASYTHQISSQMPQPYSGGMGMAGQFGPGMSFGAGGGFSYGQNRSELSGGGFGNRMVSGMAGMGSAVFNGGTGMMGGALLGGSMGGVPGALLGAGIGGIAGAGMNHIFGSMAAGAQEQNMLNRTLSQFQFQNASSNTGRGFTRQDSNAIGKMVSQMERMPEMLTSFGELNRIMDKMGQMGLMNGVRDAGEFMKKFKDTTNTLKQMSKMMGTTMEGALQAFGEMRQAGMYSKGDMMRNTLVAQTAGAVSGMGTQQVVQMQVAGGNLAHAMGGSRKGGANMMARNIAQLGMANQMGIISNDQIMEATGKEGAAGIADMAGQMSEMSYRMSQSAPGTLMTLALAETGKSGYTGGIDQKLAERVRRGEISLGELKALARKKVGQFGRNNKLFYGAHGKRMRAEMAAATGAEGQSMMLQEILGERGWQNPNAQNLVMQRFGLNEEQANWMQQMMPNLQNIGSEIRQAQGNEMKASARRAAQSEHGFDAIKHKIKKKLEHYTTDWAKDLGKSVKNYFDNWTDEFMTDLSGQYTSKVTKAMESSFKFGGKEWKQGLGAAQKLVGDNQGLRMDIGQSGGLSGLAARGMHWAGGGESAGERMDKILSRVGGGQFISREGIGSTGILSSGLANALQGGDRADVLARQGKVVLDTTLSGRISYTDKSKIEAAQKLLGSGDYGKAEAEKLKKLIGDKGVSSLTGAYERAMLSGDAAMETDPLKRQEMIYNKLRESNRAGLGGGDPFRAQMLAAQDRAGAGITDLGKARKAGLGEADITAAVQYLAEQKSGKSLGRVDWQSMGDTGFGTPFAAAALGKKREEYEKKVKGSKGGAEILKYLEGGGLMGGLTKGLFSEKGLVQMGMIGSSLTAITAAVSKDPKDWDKIPGLDSALQKYGISKEELKEKMSTEAGQYEVAQLLQSASKGDISGQDIEMLSNLQQGEAAAVIQERMQKGGKDLAKRLTSIDESKLSKEGKAALQAMRSQAKALSTADITKDKDALEKATGDMGVEEALMKLDPKSEEYRKLMEQAGPELSRTTALRKKLVGGKGGGALGGLAGKKGSGAGAQEILEAAGWGDAPQEFKDKIEGLINKGGRMGLDKDEISAVEKEITNAARRGEFGKKGEEAGSTTVSDAEIASTFKAMSDNNVKIAGVLANLAEGKKGAEAFQDLPGSEKKS